MQNYQESALMQVQFQDLRLTVQKDRSHEFIMDIATVAKGYGVTESSLRSTKSRNADELVDGKHYLLLQNATSGQVRQQIYFTKRGIVRLGFFIKSPQAKSFRDWAEDLIILGVEEKQVSKPMSTEEMIILQAQSVIEVKEKLSLIENKVQHLEDRANLSPGYFSIAAWANISKRRIPEPLARKMGKEAVKLCGEMGFSVEQRVGGKYGLYNEYPIEVLKIIFNPKP